MLTYCLPERLLTNDDLAAEYNDPEWSAKKIFRKSGIKARHIADDGMVTSDLLERSARKLFAEYSISPEDIDFVILCTQTPDLSAPGTAVIMQDRLGISTSAGAFDINLGCSAYVYGLVVAKSLITAGAAHGILLMTADLCATDAVCYPISTRILFGDAATSTLLTPDNIDKIGKCVLGTDGIGATFMCRRHGGTVSPINAKTYKDIFERIDENGAPINANQDAMNGPEIFSFSLRTVPKLVKDTLAANGVTEADIDHFVFHQANLLILNTLVEMMDLPREKVIFDIEEVGNTSSSSVPLTLKRAMEREPEKFRPGTRVLLAGFGVGYSWSGTVLTL